MEETTPSQRLHLVMGGRVTDPRGHEFQDPESIHVVGVYSSYDDAVDAWRAQAQRTVGRCRNEIRRGPHSQAADSRSIGSTMAYAIRPFCTDDADALADVTLAAIRVVGTKAYSPEQVEVWAARHPGAERFLERAEGGSLIFVAADQSDVAVAYSLLEPDGHLDMLYCHPDHTRRGLADELLAAAEQYAVKAGISRLFTEASELARPAFERAGYVVEHRRDFEIEGVAIHNYAMEKHLD